MPPRVLAALQGSRHLGITELGAILELPPSTVHGIVASLRDHGLVVKEPHGQRYMLGPTLLQLSNVYLDTLDVRARAMRWTGDLSERTGLAVRLGVEFFDQVIVIHHEPRPDGTRQMPETGVTIPAHASALGKVLLAYRPSFLQSLLGKVPLRSLTGETIVEPDDLEKTLVEVVEKGYAVEDEEAVLGEASIAVPVADRDAEASRRSRSSCPPASSPSPTGCSPCCARPPATSRASWVADVAAGRRHRRGLAATNPVPRQSQEHVVAAVLARLGLPGARALGRDRPGAGGRGRRRRPGEGHRA